MVQRLEEQTPSNPEEKQKKVKTKKENLPIKSTYLLMHTFVQRFLQSTENDTIQIIDQHQ